VIQHMVVLRFLPTADEFAIAAFADAVAGLPEKVPGVVDFVSGPDINRVRGGEFTDNWDFGVMATFATRADYETYAVHPAHVALKKEHLTGILQDRAGLQLALPVALEPSEALA